MFKNSTRNVSDLVGSHRTELMGLAAFLVLFFHVWTPVLRSIPVIGLGEGFFKRIIYFSVDIFFFVSGFGLSHVGKITSVKTFYYRRLRRIVFPFLLIGIFTGFTKGWTFKQFLFAVTGTGFWTETIYYFLWFIPAILTLYLLFPLYKHFLSSAKHPVSFTVIILEMWLLFAMIGSDIIREDFYGFLNRIPIFLLGATLAELEARHIATPFSVPVCTVTLFVGLYLSYRTNYTDMFLLVPVSNCCIPNILITLSLCPLFSLLMEKLNTVNLFRRFFKFLGTFSLELYCVQEWLASLILEPVRALLPPFFTNIVILPLMILAGYLLAYINRLFMKGLDHAIAR